MSVVGRADAAIGPADGPRRGRKPLVVVPASASRRRAVLRSGAEALVLQSARHSVVAQAPTLTVTMSAEHELTVFCSAAWRPLLQQNADFMRHILAAAGQRPVNGEHARDAEAPHVALVDDLDLELVTMRDKNGADPEQPFAHAARFELPRVGALPQRRAAPPPDDVDDELPAKRRTEPPRAVQAVVVPQVRRMQLATVDRAIDFYQVDAAVLLLDAPPSLPPHAPPSPGFAERVPTPLAFFVGAGPCCPHKPCGGTCPPGYCVLASFCNGYCAPPCTCADCVGPAPPMPSLGPADPCACPDCLGQEQAVA